jgi:hypothetical protein
MYTFLVLGLIPGTNIQINFYAWLVIMVGLIIMAYRLLPRVVRLVSACWRKLNNTSARKPLHASQLHLRGL